MRIIRLWSIVLLAGLLAGCGFQLRGSLGNIALPFSTLHITLPASSEMHAMLKRHIEATSKTRVVDSPAGAQAILDIAGDTQAKNVLSLDTSGRVREFQLVRTLGFRLYDVAGRDWLPLGQVVIRRDFAFNDAQILAKEAEEALLWRDMQTDLAQQLLRRLSAAKPPAAD